MNAETQSSEEPGTVDNQADAEAGSLEHLGALLAEAGEGDAPGGDEDAQSDGSQEKTTPTKFNDLAGAMDMDLDTLYKLEVRLDDDGDPVTIEQLKDSFKERTDFDLSVMEFEEKRTKDQSELVRAQTELNEILQALPATAVKPEVLAKIREKSEATMTRERAATMAAIPEWLNDEARTADLSAMSEHLQNYGFPVNQLESMVDHRWQRYIRDNMRREQRVREALAKVKPGKPEKNGKAAPQKRAAAKGDTTIQPKAGQSKLAAALLPIN